MKLIILLAIFLISSAAFAKEKNSRKESVTNTLSEPTHVWIINIDKVSRRTKNISILQPLLGVIKIMSTRQPVEFIKQKSVYL